MADFAFTSAKCDCITLEVWCFCFFLHKKKMKMFSFNLLEFKRNTFVFVCLFFHWLQIFNLKSLHLKISKFCQWSRVLGRLCLLMHTLCTEVTWCYVLWQMESRLGAWLSKKQRKHMALSYCWCLWTAGQKCELPCRTSGRYSMKKVA